MRYVGEFEIYPKEENSASSRTIQKEVTVSSELTPAEADELAKKHLENYLPQHSVDHPDEWCKLRSVNRCPEEGKSVCIYSKSDD